MIVHNPRPVTHPDGVVVTGVIDGGFEGSPSNQDIGGGRDNPVDVSRLI